jgi:hypothetical protein
MGHEVPRLGSNIFDEVGLRSTGGDWLIVLHIEEGFHLSSVGGRERTGLWGLFGHCIQIVSARCI